MKVLSPHFSGSLQSCTNCRALLAYRPSDIYESKYIYCPQCKTKIETHMDLSYDGVVKKDGSTST